MTRRLRWHGEDWSLSALARKHHIAPGTLAYRLDVRHLPIDRALATGTLSPSASARRNRDRRKFTDT